MSDEEKKTVSTNLTERGSLKFDSMRAAETHSRNLEWEKIWGSAKEYIFQAGADEDIEFEIDDSLVSAKGRFRHLSQQLVGRINKRRNEKGTIIKIRLSRLNDTGFFVQELEEDGPEIGYLNISKEENTLESWRSVIQRFLEERGD